MFYSCYQMIHSITYESPFIPATGQPTSRVETPSDGDNGPRPRQSNDRNPIHFLGAQLLMLIYGAMTHPPLGLLWQPAPPCSLRRASLLYKLAAAAAMTGPWSERCAEERELQRPSADEGGRLSSLTAASLRHRALLHPPSSQPCSVLLLPRTPAPGGWEAREPRTSMACSGLPLSPPNVAFGSPSTM